MEGELLRVDTALTTLPASPTNSFISTCPLLTPSPPTNALINSNEPCEPATFTIGDELASKLQHVKGRQVDQILYTQNMICNK